MCIAIYKPKGKSIPWADLRNAFENNDDGWGFCARTPQSTLVVKRGVGSFQQFAAAFDEYANSQCLIHFRIKTHGEVDKLNCHPFRVSPGLAVIHNGILPIAQNVDEKRSDTWHFVELVLKRCYQHRRDFWLRSEYQWMIEQAMGSSSKLAFLRADGEYAIFNEELGHWSDGVWYSNHSYRYTPTKYLLGSRVSYDTRKVVVPSQPLEKLPDNSDDDLDRHIADMVSQREAIDAARRDYDASMDELRKPSSNATAEEWAKNLGHLLFNEGMDESSIKDVYQVFGVAGLEALVEISSQSDELTKEGSDILDF